MKESTAENLRYTPEHITTLGKDEVFVFGSNLAGHHAGGAARTAKRLFGAVEGADIIVIKTTPV